MDSLIREQKLQEIISGSNTDGSKMLSYKDDNAMMPAYKIPVEFLMFNQYNGRIGTYIKTYEKQYGEIDAGTKEGEAVVLDFLWKSKIKRNKETLEDLRLKGQQEIGIVTKDGVVIDGNRRCMLLKKIAEQQHTSPTYFRAVILDDTLKSNPKEIRRLETIYQMGVDEKVDYNAIEKYLKCKDLSEEDQFTHEEIAKMMGEKPSDIKNYLAILDLMEKYLKATGYEGMYTVLGEEKVEGPFVDVRGYLEKHSGGNRIRDRDWAPEKDDVQDLRDVYFDYIRAGFRTAQNIRKIGNPSKGQGFFSNSELWKAFIDEHEKATDSIEERTLDELKEERLGEPIENIIKARDADWKVKIEGALKNNLNHTKRKLEDQNVDDQPMELLTRAKNSLESINTEFIKEDDIDIERISHEIRKLAESFIRIVR